MPRGKKTVGVDDMDALTQRCPKRRMRLSPGAVAAVRAWLLMIGRRHERAGRAARRAYEEAHDATQLGIIARETRAVQLIAELVAITSDRFDTADWHDAVSVLWDVSQLTEGV